MVKAIKVFDSVASIFSTCWMIVGSFYVYGSWTIVKWVEGATGATADNPTSIATADSTYCDYGTYMFAFIVITIGYISLWISVLAAICTCFCRGSESENE